jgi:hypothetical protein
VFRDPKVRKGFKVSQGQLEQPDHKDLLALPERLARKGSPVPKATRAPPGLLDLLDLRDLLVGLSRIPSPQ